MQYYGLCLIAVFCIAVQFSLTKAYQISIVKSRLDSIKFAVFASLVSAFFFFAINGFQLRFSWFTVFMAIALAAVTLVNTVLGIVIVSHGKISIYTMFMMLGGMILPFFFGLIFLRESITIFKIIGIITLIFTLMIPICFKKNKKSTGKLFYILCFIAFTLNGMIGIISKIHQLNASALPTFDFLVYNYLFAFILSSIFLGVLKFKDRKMYTEILVKDKVEMRVKIKSIILIISFAIMSGVGYMLQLIGASNLPASVLYPIITGGTVVCTSLFGAILFKEKLSKSDVLSIILAFCATFLFVL